MFTATRIIAYPVTGHPVQVTVAEQLQQTLAPHARLTPVESGEALAERGVLRVAVYAEDTSFVNGPDVRPDGDWMFAHITDGGGQLSASAPHLLFALFARLRDEWSTLDVRALSEGRVLQPTFRALTGRDELLIGRYGFLKRRRDTVDDRDVDAAFAELARVGCSHVVVNEMASRFGYERGPHGEIYYRFYDYLPDIDQYVESKLNAGTYPAEHLQANLHRLQFMARTAAKYGLVPGFYAAHPRSVPESLLQRYPWLRGARIDHTFRSYAPRYNLSVAHPLVRWHYSELMQALLRRVPEIGFMKTLLNDSGSGFEYTASLYPGRNGGPYVVREWRPDDEIAQRAAENVIRYWRVLRDAARQVNPDFVLIAGLKNIAEEQGPILAGMDTGIDLQTESQRGEVADPEWDTALAELRQRGSQAWLESHAKGSRYLLGVPSPWLTATRLQQMTDAGFDHVDVYCDAVYLAPFDPNREVIALFQLRQGDTAVDGAVVDAAVRRCALRWVGEADVERLVTCWRAADRAASLLPDIGQYMSLRFTWYRFWARPFVPDMSAIPEADRVAYEEMMLTIFNNPNNIDFGADALWTILDVETCDRRLAAFEAVWGPLAEAIDMADGMAKSGDVWVDLRDRLRAFLCYAETLRNICGWIAGVHGYLNTDDESERSRRRSQVDDTCARELDNARNLLALWERSDIDFMPLMAHGETTHHYGTNLGELLRHRIDLMERYADREPAIDPDYMWRMPPGSAIAAEDYNDFLEGGNG
ncbi:MAG: hypothetical protein QF689_04475 [Candidatus Latescibacteria bacterium]|jgi:hypothetical protein|nr:hypothetical protein [Candidatus Latescibacterota bacterium]MDP7447823.1 hypothetical protein [Candidatus Latescibacterota bacterium]HJP34256.1 hypothetical protein [Candidatus Latescibacterota bacterium]